MNFDIQRKRSAHTTDCISTKNENTNLNFINSLGVFSKYSKYPNSEKGEQILTEYLNVDKETFVLGFGSESLIRRLFFLLDYESIQILEHSYEMAFYYNKVLNKTIFINSLHFETEFEFENISKIGGDVLYLVNPHCPTGVFYTDEQIKFYSSVFKYVIIDAAYSNPLDKSFLKLSNVIYIKTFSKLGGVPGIRLGYAVGPKHIIQRLHCLRDSYEIIADSIDYLSFICDNSHLILDHIFEMNECYKLLKNQHDGYSICCANFATFDSDKFKGKTFWIKNTPFTRVTLTDKINYENLYSRKWSERS